MAKRRCCLEWGVQAVGQKFEDAYEQVVSNEKRQKQGTSARASLKSPVPHSSHILERLWCPKSTGSSSTDLRAIHPLHLPLGPLLSDYPNGMPRGLSTCSRNACVCGGGRIVAP